MTAPGGEKHENYRMCPAVFEGYGAATVRDHTASWGNGATMLLGKEELSGNVRFDVWHYKWSQVPASSPKALLKVILSHAHDEKLQGPTDVVTQSTPHKVAAASFKGWDGVAETEVLIRLWHVAQGRHFALVRYHCDISYVPDAQIRQELAECEAMVQSLQLKA